MEGELADAGDLHGALLQQADPPLITGLSSGAGAPWSCLWHGEI
jgi:hypothetical protein